MELKDDRSERVQYNYSDYPINIRRALISDYPNYSAPTHWHDDIELIAVLAGEMQYNVNGEIITLKENEGIIINARQLHFGFATNKIECDFICILLHPLMLYVSSAYERDFILPILQNRNASFIKLNTDILWQSHILENIKHINLIKSEETAPMKIHKLFLDIWLNVYENTTPEIRPKLQNADLSTLKNMVGFIQQNYNRKISLTDIAASGAVGQSKCCKLFAKFIGQTPNIYLTQYRLDKSAEYLKNTDMTVTEIAFAVGFGGSSYYAEAFRRWSGNSPSEYRQILTLKPHTNFDERLKDK